MMEKMKTTAPISSVDADGVQPYVKNHNEIIANSQEQINQQAAKNPEKSGNGRLHTMSMPELYDTVFRTENTDCRRFSLWRHISLCRCTEGGKIILHGTACLPCGNGDSNVGLSSAERNSAVSGIGR